ncbi:hypothetical protein [Lysobacter capsici]|uniref:hypothetical protein n=1 Tax=Lysobacter capsici TaxID=435897 RepID=UPI00128E244C|nr:hypothetical protein [Lysobacter capsici]
MGQLQAGVDIFGRPLYQSIYSGVQCKDRDGRFGSALSESELIEACNNAKAFSPQLGTFTVATTASSDQKIQNCARLINQTSKFPFQVHVWSWDEIETEVAARPVLANQFYSGIQTAHLDGEAKICLSSPKDQFFAFFSRPQVEALVRGKIKDHFIGICYELCDNAFQHGNATSVGLSLESHTIAIKDNGQPFDPLSYLDASLASIESHIGSHLLLNFRKIFTNVAMSYNRQDGINCIRFHFPSTLKAETRKRIEINAKSSDFFGRPSWERFADSIVIPTGTTEVVINVSEPLFLSGVAALLHQVRARLPEDVKLIVYYPRDSIFDFVIDFLSAIDIECRAR